MFRGQCKNWLVSYYSWTGQLISIIESESIRDLLRTVHPSMRRDLRTLLLFFPYVLLHAILSKTDTKYIQEEIMAVIGNFFLLLTSFRPQLRNCANGRRELKNQK